MRACASRPSPTLTYPVCEGDIDHVVGYVDAKDLFQRVLNNRADFSHRCTRFHCIKVLDGARPA
jgi:CBS domain containing-hemolysin-like protein